MSKIKNKMNMNLDGVWDLLLEDGSTIPGKLPGCTYLALLENGRIENPFYGTNETSAAALAEQSYIYRRRFTVSAEWLHMDHIDLVLDGVDTFADVLVNGSLAGKTENAYRMWQFPVKELLREGINELEIRLEAPHRLIRALQKKRPLAGMGIGIPGISYVRKPQYHFGWDWGPNLPPAGVTGSIQLSGYNTAKLEHVTVSQEHMEGKVKLRLRAACKSWNEKAALQLVWEVRDPDGACLRRQIAVTGNETEDTLLIAKPQLWWCNGMGKQPLYTVCLSLRTEEDEELDFRSFRVGLRRIDLNMEKDQWGNNFQFHINGVPLFAKGANWIPADSFINRVSEETLEFYIKSAKEANMNMLRVWGGGYYETDTFYKLCDRYGILVWQDFAFACRAYPLDEAGFLENVKEEVRDQVFRLQHHASLALWCGNNELQLEELLWARDRELRKTIHEFFFETLEKWIREADSDTPYWYGSPSDKEPGKRANSFSCGDTHLWQIWHGLMPIEAFRRFPTRFCSEFGLESLPSKNAIAAFTDVHTASLDSPDMLQHQKSSRGNQKLMYYVTQRYHHPADLEGAIYFTQIMQAEGIRSGVEYWHRNKGRCNGALYWQYNDCWPTVSWSGIDYLGQYKALHYLARSFYAPISIASERKGRKIAVHVINDRQQEWEGFLRWRCIRQSGEELSSGRQRIKVQQTGVSDEISFSFEKLLCGEKPQNAVLLLSLYDRTGKIAARNQFLVPEKKIRFEKPEYQANVKLDGKYGRLFLQSDRFAHYVEVAIEGIVQNFSDNYFDLVRGEEKEIFFELPEKMDEKELMQRLRIRSYADFPVVHTPGRDAWMRIRMRWSPKGMKGRLMTQI